MGLNMGFRFKNVASVRSAKLKGFSVNYVVSEPFTKVGVVSSC